MVGGPESSFLDFQAADGARHALHLRFQVPFSCSNTASASSASPGPPPPHTIHRTCLSELKETSVCLGEERGPRRGPSSSAGKPGAGSPLLFQTALQGRLLPQGSNLTPSPKPPTASTCRPWFTPQSKKLAPPPPLDPRWRVGRVRGIPLATQLSRGNTASGPGLFPSSRAPTAAPSVQVYVILDVETWFPELPQPTMGTQHRTTSI